MNKNASGLLLSLSFALLLCLARPAPGYCSCGISIDALEVKGKGLDVYESPDTRSESKRLAKNSTLYIVGALANSQGRWYEVGFPSRGWIRETDVPGSGKNPIYSPSRLPEGRRLLMRLQMEAGTAPQEWEQKLGRPWIKEERRSGGGEKGARTTVGVWPGIALASQKTDGEQARLIKATVCGRGPLGLGRFDLGDPGTKVRELDPSFEAEPLAVFERGKYRVALDEDANVYAVSYSEQAGEFLACPELGAPSPEEPYLISEFYPEKWCPRQTLNSTVADEGELLPYSADEASPLALLLDSGVQKNFFCADAKTQNWLEAGDGKRVRLLYSIEQRWDKESGRCVHDRLIHQGTELKRAPQKGCKRFAFFSGEARGILSRMPKATEAENQGRWEIVLDSGTALPFIPGPFFPWKTLPNLREGDRVSAVFERVLVWNPEERKCLPVTIINDGIRLVSPAEEK